MAETNVNSRLEAFSDGVFAIALTLLILDIKIPSSARMLTRTALKPRPLTKNHQSTLAMRANHRYSYYAFALYGACAIAAFWFPRTVAVAISLVWIVWLIAGINIKGE